MQKPLTRRQQVRAATIEQILTIAREEMREHGVAALSLGAIARRLGMKTPSLYTYFDSKHAIYDELFRRGYEQFGREMNARPDKDGSIREKMRAGLISYMSFAQENPELYQLMFQRPVPGFVPSDESLAVSFGLLAELQVELEHIVNGSELQSNLPFAEARDLYIALQHGLTELHLANNPELPVGQGRYGSLIDQAVDLFMIAWKKK